MTPAWRPITSGLGTGYWFSKGRNNACGKASNPNKPNTAKPAHSIRTAARRQVAQKVSNKSAPPHHKANQNSGWVMADNSLERVNMTIFSSSHHRSKDVVTFPLLVMRGLARLLCLGAKQEKLIAFRRRWIGLKPCAKRL